MPPRDGDYMQEDGDGSDFEGEDGREPGAPRLTAKEKGKGKASQSKRARSKPKEVYSWEESYTRSWDVVQEDEEGRLESAVGEFLARSRRKRLQVPTEAVRRTIVRHLILVIDLSASMMDRDLRPNRFDLTLEYSREFVTEWFDQNPLGQIGIVGMKDGVAERISYLSSNPPDVLKTIADRRELEPAGEPSLQNALEAARITMLHLPANSSREVLVIFGSLTTCDPGNIHDTLKKYVDDKIRVSVIALAAEMKICRDFANETGGVFGVSMNEGHYREMLFEHVPPPAVRKPHTSTLPANGTSNGAPAPALTGDLMMMGFPTRLPDTSPPSLCSCHGIMKNSGYLCPRCLSKLCSIPTDCNVCDLMIVSAPHLARSYHHLFPVKPYEPVREVFPNDDISLNCTGCGTLFPPPNYSVSGPITEGLSPHSRYRCPECKKDFCSECDVFVHDVLHVCPSCGV